MMDRLHLQYELTELYAVYADVLDDGELERWPELFTEDCLYRIVPRDNFERGLPLAVMHCESAAMLRDRVAALRRASVYAPRALRHIVGAPRIERIDAGIVHARASYVVLQTRLDEETAVFNAGRYLDQLVRVDGALRFRQRLCVFDSVLVPGSLVFPI